MKWMIAMVSMLWGAPAFAAFDIFLQVPGVDGGSITQGEIDSFALTGLEHGHFRVASLSGGVPVASPVVMKEITVKLTSQTGLGELLTRSLTQTVVPTMTVNLRRVGGASPPPLTMQITLNQVLITGVSSDASSGDDVPEYALTLFFKEVCFQPYETDNFGGTTPGTQACHDAAP